MTTYIISREVDLPSEKLFSIISDFTRSPSPTIPVEVEKEGDRQVLINFDGIGADPKAAKPVGNCCSLQAGTKYFSQYTAGHQVNLWLPFSISPFHRVCPA
jgi:hypothetical protein